MVRGLDYYCRTTFEWTSDQLGSQSAIAAGGRYDGLVEELGGPSIPGVGFAIGIERLTMLVRAKRIFSRPGTVVYIVWVGENAHNWAFPVVHRLRQKGLPIEIEGEVRSLKSQMRRADKLNASSVLIIGDNELDKGVALLRDMTSKQQREINLNQVEEVLLSRKAN
jgi:histidyl-tRNA synthetase